MEKVADKYAELISDRGGQVLLSHEVIGLRRSDAQTVIETTRGEIVAKPVINCAGLQSDKISRLANARLDLKSFYFMESTMNWSSRSISVSEV